MGNPPRLIWETALPVTTHSAEETLALGRRLAVAAFPGIVIGFYGDLGAGKTHLIKGICSGLGIPAERVTSPTFTIVNEYMEGDFPVFHIDAYRINRPEELVEMGFERYLEGDGLVVIEWPERIELALPPDTWRLRLSHLGGDERRIEAIG